MLPEPTTATATLVMIIPTQAELGAALNTSRVMTELCHITPQLLGAIS